jgi:hypothetical protein
MSEGEEREPGSGEAPLKLVVPRGPAVGGRRRVPGPYPPLHAPWLVENEPELVKVRSRGLAGPVLVIGTIGLMLPFLLALPAALAGTWQCWPVVVGCVLGLAFLLLAVARASEEVVATPTSLESRRRIFGARSLGLGDRPDYVGEPANGLLRALDPHLVASQGRRTVRFGRTLPREARSWLVERLMAMWQVNPDLDVLPPRELRGVYPEEEDLEPPREIR